MKTMVEILEHIVETRGAWCKSGLCLELRRSSDYEHDTIQASYESWPHWSGCIVFPVPHPDKPADLDAAEVAFMNTPSGLLFYGKYGDLRLSLARHLLKELKQ